MPVNLTKKYPELLEILHLTHEQRNQSLRGIFSRDIEDNPNFKLRDKQIFPIKSDGVHDMSRQFTHLTCEEIIEVDENGENLPPKRLFEKDRSQRLHWIRCHVEEKYPENIEIFSIIERNKTKRCDVKRTYIYDKQKRYVIVFECQRANAYYLLTAYYLNRDYAEKQLKKKMKKRLDEIL